MLVMTIQTYVHKEVILQFRELITDSLVLHL